MEADSTGLMTGAERRQDILSKPSPGVRLCHLASLCSLANSKVTADNSEQACCPKPSEVVRVDTPSHPLLGMGGQNTSKIFTRLPWQGIMCLSLAVH